MPDYYNRNAFLTDEEMKVNAQFILDYLTSRGWTVESICGMLGNMETESTINPGIYEGLDYGNTSKGYGLVQWTPATKLIDWCNTNGYDYTTMEAQLERIIYEEENNIQWISTTEHPMSFTEFKRSTESPSLLADVFITNYERPLDPDQPIRGTQAMEWYSTLVFEGIQDIISFYLSLDDRLTITSNYGWRTHPTTGERSFHEGVDIAGVEEGFDTPVPSEATITYVDSVDDSTAGKYVKFTLTKNPDYEVIIMHLVDTTVTQGDIIPKWGTIGGMGTTGRSTGVHWHVGVKDLTTGQYINPNNFIVLGGSGLYNPKLVLDPYFIMAGRRNNKRRRNK